MRLEDSFIGKVFVIEIFLFVACQRPKTAKGHFIDSGMPDVELANLRELPRGSNFIHSNNILYCIGPLTDSEIAQLPHISREKVRQSLL